MTTEERKYISEGLNVYEFIDFCNDHPLDFISYFEAIVDKTGKVYFACPSHIEKMKNIAINLYNYKDIGVNNEELRRDISEYYYFIKKYNFVSLRYDLIHFSKINKFQKNVIKRLQEAKYISESALIESIT